MKSQILLTLASAAGLVFPVSPIHAQTVATPTAAQGKIAVPKASGSLAGTLRDPSGAVVAGAKAEAASQSASSRWTRTTDTAGRFVFNQLPAGLYRLTIVVSGFQVVEVRDIAVTAGKETVVNVTLKIAPVRADVEVEEPADEAPGARRTIGALEQAASRNAAELAAEAPGVDLRANGQLAAVPLLHGLGDERAKLVVDGMTVSAACANHMNPALSYVAPAQAAQVTVLAGITPVSAGGDSLGGTIAVDAPQPVFASQGERVRQQGTATGYYRSNGQNYGGSLVEWLGGRNLALGYTGSWSSAENYTDGAGHKVTSTYAQTTDHLVTLAAQSGANLLTLQAGLHHTPYEGFVSAQMDMVRNYAESLNLHYRRSFGEGSADARVYWQNTWHSMNIGRDKSTFPMPMWMPMNTHGRDTGYALKIDLPLTLRHTLRASNELHRFVLDDTWPAVAGTAPYMGPDTFVSINGGHRVRLGSYVELASRWNPRWTTLAGLRNDTVWTNAGAVQGYSAMYAADATAFNAAQRAHADPLIDLTAQARYQATGGASLELGYARKSRAPNLYERYAWSTNWMASGMIGWFGDGNYYVGAVGLKPEVAHTVSATAALHGGSRTAWELKATPYFTRIQQFIDVDTLDTTTYGMSTFAQLRFANHPARIYGADFSGKATLWKDGALGAGKLAAVAGWLHGDRLDTHTALYQMMPLHARLTVEEEWRGLSAGVGVEAVDRKRHLDPNRMEQATAGYALVNLHGGYRRGFLEAGASADNLLNRSYALPLGGVNMDDFMAGMWMGAIQPLTGRGRSAAFSLVARF